MAAKKQKTERYAILANSTYGLYAGIVESETVSPDGTLRVEVRACRHVARWYGRTGGITSLAVHGLCGPRASESRIGAPAEATLTGIRNIFTCSPTARASLESSAQS